MKLSRRQAIRLKHGLCIRCADADVLVLKYLCLKCADKSRQEKRIRRKLRVKQGLCVDCGIPAENGNTRCATHRTANNARIQSVRANRKESGLCSLCSKPSPTASMCFGCRWTRATKRKPADFGRGLMPNSSAGVTNATLGKRGQTHLRVMSKTNY